MGSVRRSGVTGSSPGGGRFGVGSAKNSVADLPGAPVTLSSSGSSCSGTIRRSWPGGAPPPFEGRPGVRAAEPDGSCSTGGGFAPFSPGVNIERPGGRAAGRGRAGALPGRGGAEGGRGGSGLFDIGVAG